MLEGTKASLTLRQEQLYLHCSHQMFSNLLLRVPGSGCAADSFGNIVQRLIILVRVKPPLERAALCLRCLV